MITASRGRLGLWCSAVAGDLKATLGSAYDTQSQTAVRSVARRGTRISRRLGSAFQPAIGPMGNRIVVGAAARLGNGSRHPEVIRRPKRVSYGNSPFRAGSARTRVCSKTALIAGPRACRQGSKRVHDREPHPVEESHSANTSCSVFNVAVSVLAETTPSFFASRVLSAART